MFSTYKVAFYMTTYRYHVKSQDIGQPIRLFIILDTIEFLCAGTDAATRFALAAGDWWTAEMRPTTAQCRVLTYGQSTRAVALYANNKRTRVTSKLALWFFIHSRTALVVRDYCGCLPMYARIPPST